MADKTAPALQTETRAGTVFAWNRKGGDWAVRLGDRVPGSWPQTKRSGPFATTILPAAVKSVGRSTCSHADTLPSGVERRGPARSAQSWRSATARVSGSAEAVRAA